jgi:anhydro-N-acetylmuramic acid kinase
MNKTFFSLGLMSGTSMDGIDCSIIQSNGIDELKVLIDNYYPYNKEFRKKIHLIRDKINSSKDIKFYSKELKLLEKEITILHAEVVNKMIKKTNFKIDFVGFHGQTIFHNANEKISKQLGDGYLLSKLIKTNLVYDFRSNDLKNGGEGAPLTPIYHSLISKKLNKKNISFLNLGGIANETTINEKGEIFARDLGPANCLIDSWIKLNSNKDFDNEGNIAKSGKVNKIILDQFLDFFYNNNISKKKSYDIKDFNISFLRGLSIEDGAATLTEFTSEILSKKISNINIFVCGGGRKNKFLLEKIENKIKIKLKLIDEIGFDGDFIESQAFAFLAIRSYLKLPISFPKTTGCFKPCSGGVIIKKE